MDEIVEERIENQFYLIDKPLTWTSFDVVRKLKNLGKFKKIGHAGTLDPLATGLLIICVGKHTKKIDYFQSLPKTYTGTFVLGKTTPSIDLETAFNQEFPIDHITTDQIKEVIQNKLLGEIKQIPPIYSAIKLDGKRLYTHARQGVTDQELPIKIREATIYRFDVDSTNFPEIGFEIECSKGTYIRSIVRDLGEFLDSGAYLNKLVRTKIGEYAIDKAQSIESFNKEYYATLS
ncbi:MAG: tRNA pseudouridine(55) synthase [Bacteroidota bacterium]|jgi:tRNA pseudouridine55 synthase